MDDDNEAERRRLRKLWREHFAEHEKVAEAWRARGYQYPPPVFPPFPDELRGLTCGAKTRAGTPCKRKDLYTSARCPLHGGAVHRADDARGQDQGRRERPQSEIVEGSRFHQRARLL